MNEEQQSTDTVIMVSPDHFQFNEETAADNVFQKIKYVEEATEKAMHEFDQMVATLREHKINVLRLASPADKTPDAVFPNNWFSVHRLAKDNIVLVIYPMFNKNRRLEKQTKQLKEILAANHINVNNVIDLSHFEATDKALEGTGSLIFDRVNKVAYAALSSRTNKEALVEFAQHLNYRLIVFNSHDSQDKVIYHTNIVMTIGERFVVICDQAIKNDTERKNVIDELGKSGKAIITISIEQMEKMAGNILQVTSIDKKAKIVLSETAFHAFTDAQRKQLQSYGELVVVSIPTIEQIGGGSARCMLSEVFY